MFIRSFQVDDLFGRTEVISSDLNRDINILTGRNGSGKTSILKLLWYIMSGNILMALREIDFSSATLITSEYECKIYRLTRSTCRVELERDGKRSVYEDDQDPEGDVIHNAEDFPNVFMQRTGSSVFLPTFRRIEGGFGIGEQASGFPNRLARTGADIEESLISLSKKISKKNHVFVSSISTVDIVSLLLRQMSELSESSNDIQQVTSQGIIETIRHYKTGSDETRRLEEANNVLDQVMSEIKSMEEKRGEIMAPLEAVRDLVKKLFKHSGIKMDDRLSFGDTASAVNSDALSAGEKQMLSFICYNAFYKDSCIFIDEPELSLHVDWQRQLFSILKRQQSSNQFIIATHSPFIYSKYADKEIVIDSDRGDTEAVYER